MQENFSAVTRSLEFVLGKCENGLRFTLETIQIKALEVATSLMILQ
jgi:hypothetical protein